ncbi:MAG: hypothetical protein HYX53_00510 [Chloroflexi bacterium]|nr:hypothetical protein [Chloroflexota bacterium]
MSSPPAKDECWSRGTRAISPPLHYRWLGEGRSHAGIAITLHAYSVGEARRRVLNLAARFDQAAMTAQLQFPSRWG